MFTLLNYFLQTLANTVCTEQFFYKCIIDILLPISSQVCTSVQSIKMTLKIPSIHVYLLFACSICSCYTDLNTYQAQCLCICCSFDHMSIWHLLSYTSALLRCHSLDESCLKLALYKLKLTPQALPGSITSAMVLSKIYSLHKQSWENIRGHNRKYVCG